MRIIVSRLVPGGKGKYRASTDGTIWTRYSGKWKRMKPSIRKRDGYSEVRMILNGRRLTKLVHVIVLLTFRGPRPKGMIARHYPDRNPTNVALANLSYSTYKRNQEDRKEHGTSNDGERNGQSKLTHKAVRHAKRLKKLGYTQTRIAYLLGVTQGQISRALNNKAWKGV